jgi:hypothetical protein
MHVLFVTICQWLITPAAGVDETIGIDSCHQPAIIAGDNTVKLNGVELLPECYLEMIDIVSDFF